MRGRGLKPIKNGGTRKRFLVAPHAGAWIETKYDFPTETTTPEVAPHAGAWIETLQVKGMNTPTGCRPPCGGVD